MKEITVLELLRGVRSVCIGQLTIWHIVREKVVFLLFQQRKKTCSYASDWHQWHEAIKTDSRSNNSWHNFPHQSVIHRTVMCMFLFNWWVATRDKASFEDWRALWTWWSIKKRKRRKSISISNVCVYVRLYDIVNLLNEQWRVWESKRTGYGSLYVYAWPSVVLFFSLHEIGNKREYPQVNRRRWDEVNQALCFNPDSERIRMAPYRYTYSSSRPLNVGVICFSIFVSMLDWFLFRSQMACWSLSLQLI